MQSSTIVDTYLKSDSYRLSKLVLSPAASFSIVSIVGLSSLFIIFCIVDFESPVILETWRIDKVRLYMISASSIFILTFYTLKCNILLVVFGNYVVSIVTIIIV